MSEVKNNVNINNNVALVKNKEKANQEQQSNLNINVNNTSSSFTPLNAKIADAIGYAQDLFSSSTISAQEFVEENPAFAFKTVAENLKSNVLSGVYSSFSEVVDKLLLGAFRGVTLGLDAWQFIKKLREKIGVQKAIEEKNKILEQEIKNLSEEQKAQLKQELEKLERELDEKKIDLGVSGGRVLTDLLGFVGAVAAAFSLPALATAAPYLIGIALVGDIVGISYFAYKAIKNGVQNFTQKIAQRREKEMKTQQIATATS